MILTKRAQANRFFEKVVKKVQNVKIKSIFELSSNDSEELFILFEEDLCLVICRLVGIDAFKVELREMTKAEKEKYSNLMIKDGFDASLYDCIKSVDVKCKTHEREVIIEEELDFVLPTEELFDVIIITMKNENALFVSAIDEDVTAWLVGTWEGEDGGSVV